MHTFEDLQFQSLPMHLVLALETFSLHGNKQKQLIYEEGILLKEEEEEKKMFM